MSDQLDHKESSDRYESRNSIRKGSFDTDQSDAVETDGDEARCSMETLKKGGSTSDDDEPASEQISRVKQSVGAAMFVTIVAWTIGSYFVDDPILVLVHTITIFTLAMMWMIELAICERWRMETSE